MVIAVLGPLTIEGEWRNLARRDRVVLAALAVHPGEVVSAGVLADALWGERPPASAVKVIQGCVVRLRKLLGSHSIETSPDGYRLTIPHDQIDSQRFERAVGRAGALLAVGEAERAAVVLADVLTLWRGRPFEEIAEWDSARIELARLTELRQFAQELYIESALRSGGHDGVLSQAKALTAEAPLRERRWALLATAQYQAGRQGEALETLRRLRVVLDDELGLDPSPEIDALEQAILRQDRALSSPSALPEPSAACPYQGLRPYDVDDAELFFGRDTEVAAGLRKLSDHSMLAVAGPSGCGKSSLIRAGVAAALRADGGHVVAITPGLHPMKALAAALPGVGPRPTLVVDQCEEVFSLCQDEGERRAFLSRLTEQATDAALILAFRADGLADISSYPGFAHAVEEGLHLLTGMSEAELRAAITEPARLASLIVEPGLVDLLVAEAAGRPGALPLLSHALAETWQRREGRTLTVAGYRASGGIQGAVAQSAEQVYAQLTPGQRPMLKALLLRLVASGPDRQPVRSRLPRRSVVTGPESDQLVNRLISARLVTSDDGVVELAHEALARAWPRLRGWLDDDLEGQQLLHHLTQVADSWDSLGRPDSELYRGVRLAKVWQWRDQAAPDLTATEQDFLSASRQLADAELRAAENRARHEARINRRLRAALALAATLLVGALIAGVLAVGQAQRADRQAAAAEQSATIAAAGRAGAKAVVQSDIDTSLLLAVAAVRMNPSPESRANLLAALAKHPQLISSLETERVDSYGLEVSADGHQAFIYTATNHVLSYDLTTGNAIASYEPPNRSGGARHLDLLGPMARSPGGRELAVGTPPPTTEPVLLLDPTTLQPTGRRLPGFTKTPARATHVGYSHDGRSLVAMIQYYGNGATSDFSAGAVFVWTITPGASPALRKVVPLPAGAVQDVVLSPAGDRFYLTKPVAAYEVATGKQLWSRADLAFVDADVSPDGKSLALAWEAKDTSSAEYSDVLVLDASTGATVHRLSKHTSELRHVRFSHAGTWLVSTGADNRAVVWDTASGSPLEEMPIFDGDTLTAAFSPDDDTLYTSGGDGAIRSWDLPGRHRYLSWTRRAQNFQSGCRVIAPGGRRYFRLLDYDAGYLDPGDPVGGFVDSTTGKVVPFDASQIGVSTRSCGTWHPDGARFAMGDSNGKVFVEDARTGRLLANRKVTASSVLDLDYSGLDGSRLVVGDESGLARMLDGATLRDLSKPVQVGGPVAFLSASPDNRSAFVVIGGRHISDRLDVDSNRWALVDLTAGRVVRRGSFSMSVPSLVAFAPDGTRVAVGSEKGEVLVVDPATGKDIAAPQLVHQGFVNGIAFSPDSSLLVSAGFDAGVSLFDGKTAALLGSIATPHQQMVTADFLPDGHTIAIAAYDEGVYHWDTRLEHAVDTACRMTGRDLTAAEWRENFGDRPYRTTC
ncbi:BTAD domain-containing putative transcriptional regulator [Kribbella sp. VKM Ac-2566]|uniref:nSTAND1 domain-containing NTPase n=1 Tax=Kribbella sp. VKM Ac-2566 TaxID=2512218 RepID=UPI0010624F9F|nr:BTAD domain-containing putative transcriptional regulator [Kribbella sp. VKM Ac-2566]TDW98572.1 DNA-binding SARP family transcriptional activator [Kribbella sp. VKM Ac-2566]